ncbi:MAG: sigma-70 family RNA polymerase sigma factor [Clostridia bacterium]|nr:sigma-70 family RNA polymerase sigma factor [Clostridia bacterium]
MAELYAKHKKKMFYCAFEILKDSYSAEDAVHEAFIAVSRNLSKLSSADSPETAAYCCRAAKTRALNILEMKKRELEHGRPLDENEDILFEESEFERICALSDTERIARCINRLPQIYREVIVLKYLDDMSVARISKALGRNRETVKKQLLRARGMLKKMLEEETL